MKSNVFGCFLACLIVTSIGCEKESSSVTDGVELSEIEQYNKMVAESEASLADGEKAMADEGLDN